MGQTLYSDSQEFFHSDREALLDDVTSKKLLVAVIIQAYEDLESIARRNEMSKSSRNRETIEFWESEIWEALLKFCELEAYIPNIRDRIQSILEKIKGGS